jgi:hypothetical protein
VQQLTEQQVRHWINSIVGMEGPDDGEHSLSPSARFLTLALADVMYVPTHSQLERVKSSQHLRKFRSFLGEVVRVMDDCGVRPWTAADERQASS